MNDEIKDLDIASDEYQYEACSITCEECCGISCRTCETARRQMEQIQEDENKSICTFKEKTQNGIAGEINLNYTVLKIDTVENAFTHLYPLGIPKQDEFTKIVGLLDKEVIDAEHPHLNIVMDALDLKPCTESYYLQTWPLITVHGNVVLVTAPLVESDTDK